MSTTAASPSHATTGALDLDGVCIAYDDVGPRDAPVVVCLHAIGHDASDWAHLAAHLQPRHRVIALDFPAQGRSGSDREPPNAARYADLTLRLLDALAIPAATLIGNSIGGAAALRVAAEAPTRVRALVLANPGGLDGGVLPRLACRMMARFFRAGARGWRLYPPLFARYYRGVLPAAPAAVAQRRIIARARELAPLLAAAWRGFAQPDADLRPRLPSITCPVLFTWATRDRFIRLARNLPAIRRLPHAELVRFDCGHAPQLETPDAFATAVAAFLSS